MRNKRKVFYRIECHPLWWCPGEKRYISPAEYHGEREYMNYRSLRTKKKAFRVLLNSPPGTILSRRVYNAKRKRWEFKEWERL